MKTKILNDQDYEDIMCGKNFLSYLFDDLLKFLKDTKRDFNEIREYKNNLKACNKKGEVADLNSEEVRILSNEFNSLREDVKNGNERNVFDIFGRLQRIAEIFPREKFIFHKDFQKNLDKVGEMIHLQDEKFEM